MQSEVPCLSRNGSCRKMLRLRWMWTQNWNSLRRLQWPGQCPRSTAGGAPSAVGRWNWTSMAAVSGVVVMLWYIRCHGEAKMKTQEPETFVWLIMAELLFAFWWMLPGIMVIK